VSLCGSDIVPNENSICIVPKMATALCLRPGQNKLRLSCKELQRHAYAVRQMRVEAKKGSNATKAVAKANLPTKICIECKRPFTWYCAPLSSLRLLSLLLAHCMAASLRISSKPAVCICAGERNGKSAGMTSSKHSYTFHVRSPAERPHGCLATDCKCSSESTYV
jgi:hypothetical protein